jgi:hypothetical protein
MRICMRYTFTGVALEIFFYSPRAVMGSSLSVGESRKQSEHQRQRSRQIWGSRAQRAKHQLLVYEVSQLQIIHEIDPDK